MRHWSGASLLFACGFFLALTPAARGVVAAEAKLSDFYNKSRFVVTGKVAKVEGSLLDVDSVQVLKAPPPRVAAMKVKVDQPPDLAARLKPGDSIVVLEQDGVTLVHVGDAWLLAQQVQRGPSPGFLTKSVHPAKDIFPGRTPGLVAALTELKDGKPSLLNEFHQDIFGGGVKELGKTLPNAAFAIAADVNGDGKEDLCVCNGEQIQLLLSTGDGLTDATTAFGLQKIKGLAAAAGDVDGNGKLDLFINGHVLFGDGGKFHDAGPVKAQADADTVAVGIADVDGDGKPDLLVLQKSGLLRGALGGGGGKFKPLEERQVWPADKPAIGAAISADFGDDGKPAVMVLHESGVARYSLAGPATAAADFHRLTGKQPAAANSAAGLLASVPIDVNGDGRLDLLTVTARAGDLYVNRGFGAFLVDSEAHKLLRSRGQQKVPFELKPGTRLVAADLRGDKFDDLVVITPEGAVYALDNLPPKPKQ